MRQDARLNHKRYVEADNAEQAADVALAAWKGDTTFDVPLRPTGESKGFDAAICAEKGRLSVQLFGELAALINLANKRLHSGGIGAQVTLVARPP